MSSDKLKTTIFIVVLTALKGHDRLAPHFAILAVHRVVAHRRDLGFTLSEAAEKIGIPYKTADGYRGIIYGKLQICSRPELTAWAILTGLVDARSVSRKRRKPSKKKSAKSRRRRCPTCGRLI